MNCKSLTTSGKPCRRKPKAGETYCHMHVKTANAPPSAAVRLATAERLVDNVATRDEGRAMLTKIMRGEFVETKTTSTGEVYEAETPLKYRIEATQLLARIDGWVEADSDKAARPPVGVYKPG